MLSFSLISLKKLSRKKNDNFFRDPFFWKDFHLFSNKFMTALGPKIFNFGISKPKIVTRMLKRTVRVVFATKFYLLISNRLIEVEKIEVPRSSISRVFDLGLKIEKSISKKIPFGFELIELNV